MEGDDSKGMVCVTGGTGYLASWLIMKLLQHGYSVNATIWSTQVTEENCMKYPSLTPFVHVDDVANAHIHLLENGKAKGRYICSAVEVTPDELYNFLSARYPEYRILHVNSLREIGGIKHPSLSSKKLLETGFKYKYGLEEMFDGAIECCKQRVYFSLYSMAESPLYN